MLVSIAEFVCLNSAWFRHEFSAHRVMSCSSFNSQINNNYNDLSGDWIGLDSAVSVIDDTMKYCFGRRDSLSDITFSYNGEIEYFFNQRELHHLADCRAIFLFLTRLRNVCLLILLISLIIIIKKRKHSMLLKCFPIMSYLSLALTIIVSAIFAMNFDAAFDRLHELVFDNYLWIMNPLSDRLIRLITPEIVAETGVLILASWAVSALLLAFVCEHKLKS